jgi:CBS domain containing-hemolysin-like protein
MPPTIVVLAVIGFLVFLNALYVAAEFSSVSSRTTRIKQWANAGRPLARQLLPIVESPRRLDDYIAASQLGITASSLILGAFGQSAIATALVPALLGLGSISEAAAHSIAATSVLLFLTLLQVVLGELLPKSISLRFPERLALLTVIPMRWSVALFRPFILLFNGSGSLILRALGQAPHREHTHVHSPEEIELLVGDSREGGLIEVQEQRLLRNVLRLRDLTARQVMIPRIRLVTAPLDSSVDELIGKSCESHFSRIPLYDNSIDNIVGFIHIKDLFRLRARGQQQVGAALRKVVYIPEGLPIIDVWQTLSNKRQYLAIILDEYGGTAGMITFEDLIDEVFGELNDGIDELSRIEARPNGPIRLPGNMLISDVNEYLGLDLPDDEADTLAGLVLSELDRLPDEGEEVAIDARGTTIRVEAMEERSVMTVSLRLPPSRPEADHA